LLQPHELPGGRKRMAQQVPAAVKLEIVDHVDQHERRARWIEGWHSGIEARGSRVSIQKPLRSISPRPFPAAGVQFASKTGNLQIPVPPRASSAQAGIARPPQRLRVN
jgi:hypothetical protein